MNRRASQVGFSQRVRLEWLEQTANLVLAGNDRTSIAAVLQESLKDSVSVGGNAVRSNRDKVITILMKVWLNVPHELDAFRRDGLEMLGRLPRRDRIAVHWGMVMAVYPFWAAVAGHVGRLLRLQGSAAAAHIQRRTREQYGERQTVSRAAHRVLRSYVDWGVLIESGKKGVYNQGLSLPIDDCRLVSWLIEASLHTRPSGFAPLKDLVDGTCLFPFHFEQATTATLPTGSPRLDILRLGLDDDLAILRK